MKISKRPKAKSQIRVLRVSKNSVVHPIERQDSRIRSSVDSWLSSEPSIQEPKHQSISKKSIARPSNVKPTEKEPLFRRGCIAFSAAVLIILILCSIVGVILAVKLQSTTTIAPNQSDDTTSH